MVLVLEVLIKNIGIDEEDKISSSVGYFDSITYVKTLWVHF